MISLTIAPTVGLMLEAEELTRAFTVGKKKINALKDISLTVAAGECLFLTGASGSGKTTLLYTLAGLEQPNFGTVRLAGESFYDMSKRRQAILRNTRMGYVFQSYFLLPEFTALENAALPSRIAGQRSTDQAAELLDKVGLGHRLHHLPNELSGGEQQRVAIARALVNDPEILFADEPTGNLDPKTGGSVIDLLLSVVAESGKTIIVVTHDSVLAERGDRKLVLVDGHLVD